MTSRIDYGNAQLANAPRTTTDKLQRVLNAAARVITATRKFDRGLTHILHDELHWLDVPQRVAFKLCTTVYKCLHGLAPQYLSELCVPVADVAGRLQLRSASRGLLSILSSLHDNLRPTCIVVPGTYCLKSVRKSTSTAIFKRSLKTFLFVQIMHSAH